MKELMIKNILIIWDDNVKKKKKGNMNNLNVNIQFTFCSLKE